jgi:superfamily II DNA/RNA helicase
LQEDTLRCLVSIVDSFNQFIQKCIDKQPPAVWNAMKSHSNHRVSPVFSPILCPTRELAIQLTAEANVLLKCHQGIGVLSLIGGTRFKLD